MKSKIDILNKEEIIELITTSNSIREILLKIGYKETGTYLYDKFREHLNSLGIDIPKYKNLNIPSNWKKYSMNEILVEDSKYKSRKTLKDRILRSGLKEYKCDVCGNDGRWNGSDLSLQLEHRNGVNNDNRIENLCFLCPNCHSQTKTFAGRNIKREKIVNYCNCGSEIDKGKKECRKCVVEKLKERNKKNRKVNRPDISTILESVNRIGYVATGKLYGVSDNTIRKWIKWSI